jgi:hypothetical protein
MNRLAFLIACAVLALSSAAHADWTWKDRAKATIEAAALEQAFRTMPIMSDMPNWLRTPYPSKRRKLFR